MTIKPTARAHRARHLLLGLAATAVAGAGLAASHVAPADAAAFPEATVHANGGLIGHIAPSRQAPRNYVFGNGSTVSVDCRVRATPVQGNRTWYLIAAEGDANWVSGRYLTVHGHSEQCSDRSIDATATKSTGLFLGPTRQDARPGALAKGDSLVVRCYTGSPTVSHWMLTEKDHWVKASALHPTEQVPYCSQTV